MKILLGYKLILDVLLNKSISSSSACTTLCEIIFKSSHPQFYITRLSLNKIHDLTSMSKSIRDADNLVASLESKFTICEGSPIIFENARHLESDIDEAIDLECCRKLGDGVIVTQSPEIYVGSLLHILSVEQFILRYKLENQYIAPSTAPLAFHQHSLPLVIDKYPSTYMIRNTIPIIMRAIKTLKSAGFRGLTKQEFATEIDCTGNTAKSIIWDLKKFKMASSYRDRVEINPKLLDTGDLDISRYLSVVLKEHSIVQEIHKEVDLHKAITKWRLQQIIASIYSCKEHTKGGSIDDYRSRIISWLEFANLLVERGKDTFVIPSVESFIKSDCPNYLHEQLSLFERLPIA